MLGMLKATLENTTFRVKIERNKVSEAFQNNIGVKQGCQLFPVLFNLYINDIEEEILSVRHHAPNLNGVEIPILLYADDLVLISQTKIGLQKMLQALESFCDKWKLEVNIEKTKVMVFKKRGAISRTERWYYKGQKVEVAPEYRYLGVIFSRTGSWGKMGESMHNKGKQLWIQLLTLQKNLRLSKQVAYATKLLDMLVLPGILYGAEVWRPSKMKMKLIEATHMKFLRGIIALPNSASSVAVKWELGRISLKAYMDQQRIRFWERLWEKDDAFLVRAALQVQQKWALQGKNSWGLYMLNLFNEVGLSFAWRYGPGGSWFLLTAKRRIVDIEFQKQYEIIKQQRTLSLYKEVKETPGMAEYLEKVSEKDRRTLAVFRLGIYKWKTRNWEYKCPYCWKAEDDYHVLLECEAYVSMRKNYLSKYFWKFPSKYKLKQLFAKDNSARIWSSLAKCIREILEKRENHPMLTANTDHS
jgi:hypothetical protein